MPEQPTVSGVSPDLNDLDRDILSYRPEINYIEPEVEARAVPTAAPLTGDPAVDIDTVKNLATTVGALADAVQKRADIRAKGLQINLQKGADSLTIQAMRRHYPDSDPNVITYEQYRACKDAIREHGRQLAEQAMVTLDQVQAAKTADDPTGAMDTYNSLKNGGMDPARNQTLQLVEPLDMDDVQTELIKKLVNLIWSKFIKKQIPLPPGVSVLPDEIA